MKNIVFVFTGGGGALGGGVHRALFSGNAGGGGGAGVVHPVQRSPPTPVLQSAAGPGQPAGAGRRRGHIRGRGGEWSALEARLC